MDFLRPDGKEIEINSKEEAADYIRKSCNDCKKYDYTMHTCSVRSYLFCMHMRELLLMEYSEKAETMVPNVKDYLLYKEGSKYMQNLPEYRIKHSKGVADFLYSFYADKQEYGIKDYKGQTVISNYMYFDKKLKTNAYIHGKTFVKPGKYDSLYPDAEYYVKDANTKMGLKLKLLNYAVKTYRSNDYLVLVYFAESLLIAIVLALVAYIHVCENGKKESDCAKNDENIC